VRSGFAHRKGDSLRSNVGELGERAENLLSVAEKKLLCSCGSKFVWISPRNTTAGPDLPWMGVLSQ